MERMGGRFWNRGFLGIFSCLGEVSSFFEELGGGSMANGNSIFGFFKFFDLKKFLLGEKAEDRPVVFCITGFFSLMGKLFLGIIERGTKANVFTIFCFKGLFFVFSCRFFKKFERSSFIIVVF